MTPLEESTPSSVYRTSACPRRDGARRSGRLVVKIVHKRELKVEEEVPAAEAVVPAEGEAAPRAKPRRRRDSRRRETTEKKK